LELIQQQLAESKTLDDVARRITVVIRSAELLWPYERDKARTAFVEAWDLSIQHFKDKGDKPVREGSGLLIGTPDMRYEVITAVARHDFDWANKLTEQLFLEQENAAKEKALTDAASEGNNSERLLTLARSLLTSNQSAAINFATLSLRFTATFHLPMFLYKLAEVDRAAADQLYERSLMAYSHAPMDRFLYLSAYPFGNTRDAGETPGYTLYKVPNGFIPNLDLQRSFVKTFLGRVQQEMASPSQPIPGGRLTNAEQMWLALTRLYPQIARNLPALAPVVEQARVNITAQLPEELKRRAAGRMAARTQPQGSFDETVEAAEKNPNVDQRDQQLAMAVMRASETEDLDLILRVIDKISDSQLRTQFLNWFYFSRTQSAIKQKQFTQARNLAAKVQELDQRAYLYLQIAEESLKENLDQSQAREMLEEVVTAAAKTPASMITARTQLGVAHLYTKIDHARAIAVLAQAVTTINALESPDFSRQFVIRKIEGKTFGSYASFQTPGFNPETALREISKSDFDGTLNQASTFASKPLRALTTLAVVEPCLKLSKPSEAKPRSKTQNR
jgi:hypothetical protein